MRLKTVLNKCCKFKSFVTEKTEFNESGDTILVFIRRRSNAIGICSECGKPAPGYDKASEPRQFEFIPFWGYRVKFQYRMHRVNCPRCGVRVERIPWADGNKHLTRHYQVWLAGWAKQLSWKVVAERFRTSGYGESFGRKLRGVWSAASAA